VSDNEDRAFPGGNGRQSATCFGEHLKGFLEEMAFEQGNEGQSDSSLGLKGRQYSRRDSSQVQWLVPVVPALKRLRQENCLSSGT
jgi:hypothetical protein